MLLNNPARTGIVARPLSWVLVFISLVPLCVVLPMASVRVGVAALIAWIALLWIAIGILRGYFHYIVPVWIAVYPYCYYLLSFPREKSIFTLDRALILCLAIEMLLVWRQVSEQPLSLDIRVSAWLWGLYVLVCFLTLAGHPLSQVLPSYRQLVDGMIMPAILGLYAIRFLPLLQDLRKIHVCACILGLGLFLTGLIELTTGIDLFPWIGSEPMFTETHVRRADGPFEQQIVLCLVAILVFFFVIYLRRLMPGKMPPWQTALHKAGSLAAFGAALLPLNRGLVLILIPIAVIDSLSPHRLFPRRIWPAFFGIILFAAIAAKLADPRLYDDRVSRPDNFYQRLAQHRETLRVVREYPLLGVGFGLYHDVASQNPQYMATWEGIESMNYPHNAFMTVLSEEGIIGLIFYIAAEIFLFRAMWKIRRVYPPGWLAFLYCFLTYVLTGLDYATVYFSDINLIYILILAIIYKLQSTMAQAQEASLPGHSRNDWTDLYQGTALDRPNEG